MKNSKVSLLAMALMFGATLSTDKKYFMEQKNKKPIPNGCKEYSFYGQTVIALNEKSAIKKCKRLASIK